MRRILLSTIKILISAALLYLALRKANFSDLASRIDVASLGWLGLAIADAVVVRLVRTGQMTPADFTTTDYFGDESVAADTYPYFDFLLDGRRVWREPYHGVVMVAGHEEVLAVLRDTASFSNCNIVAGPSFRFPVELTGDDVTEAAILGAAFGSVTAHGDDPAGPTTTTQAKEVRE